MAALAPAPDQAPTHLDRFRSLCEQDPPAAMNAIIDVQIASRRAQRARQAAKAEFLRRSCWAMVAIYGEDVRDSGDSIAGVSDVHRHEVIRREYRRERGAALQVGAPQPISGVRAVSRPRERRERRHVARSTSSGDSGADPHEPAGPGWRWAHDSFETCPRCGFVLVWASGRLICPRVGCPGKVGGLVSEVTASRDNGRRSRPVGYAPWEPRGKTRDSLDQILSVLDDHRDYWPITPRQVLYRLMGRNEATKADAEKIGERLNRGRRAGLIPWEAIGDGRTESAFPVVCDDPEAFFAEMRQSASAYRLDRQEGQEVYIEVVVEAAGAVEQVFRTTGGYSVPVLSGSGFVPITALRGIVLRAEARDVPTLILIAGDLDPAGRDIRDRVAADVAAFAEDHNVDIEVATIALREHQVDLLGLIRAPMDAKKRAKYPWWPHDWTVELEAVSPDDLASIVAKAIENHTDADVRQAVIDREAEERAELKKQLEAS